VQLQRRSVPFVLIAFVFFAGLASYPIPLFATESPGRAVEEDNIREAVFRYRIIGWKSKGPFFLTIDGQDPTDSFMARFASSKSEAYFKKEPIPGWLRDRSTDEEGISFSVKPIRWLSPDRVEVCSAPL
jgi:hypothetical protein